MTKFLLPSLALLYSLSSVAQATGVANETSIQQTLYNNATKSQEGKTKTVEAIDMKNSRGSEEKIYNLTDQEKEMSDNFVHQGKGNRVVDEKCNASDEMKKICAGQAGNHKFMGMNPEMVKMVAKAYALFGSMGDVGELKVGSAGKNAAGEATKTAKGAAKAGEPEKASDWCKHIPTATEMLAQFQQQNAQQLMNSLPTNQDTAQKDALEKTAKSHDEKAKQSQILATGWYGGAACYGARMATGGIAVDTTSVLKLGAATLLGTFYQSEVNANKEYAQKVRDVSKALPGKGDCNPITDKLCYCSEPSTENDPQYCLKEMHQRAIAKNSVRTACIDEQLKTDPTCKCQTTNSCYDTISLTNNGIELGIGTGSGGAFNGVRDLVRGELKGGTLTGEAYNGSKALANKALQLAAEKLPDSTSLNANQKIVADDLVSRGIPRKVANLLATTPMPPGGEKFTSKFQGGDLVNVSADAYKAKSNIIEFTGGDGINPKPEKKSDDGFDLSKFMGGKKAGNEKMNARVLQFLGETQGRAISNKDKPIFDIISNRYQLSGRKRLEVEVDK